MTGMVKKDLSVYISVDMEGVAGVVAPADVWEMGGEFERARILVTGETNAAIQSAFDCGASQVLVNDSHMYMRNIHVDQLDQRAQLIRGSRKPGFMMQGIEAHAFDLALFIGYHSMAGTKDGVLCHTFSDQWAALRINNGNIGEATYNAIYAGEYKCPVGLVSGDASLKSELNSNLPWIEHVVVKQGIGRFAAVNLSPNDAQKHIYEGTKRAIQNLEADRLHLYNVDFPIEVQVQFYYPDRADLAVNIPGVERINSLTVKFDAANLTVLHKTIVSIIFFTG